MAKAFDWWLSLNLEDTEFAGNDFAINCPRLEVAEFGVIQLV